MPQDQLEHAQALLWAPEQIGQQQIEAMLGRLMTHQIDYGELYFQSSTSESWIMENGIIKNGNFSISKGVGVRAVSGEKTGFAYADEIALPAIQQATDAARGIARSGGDQQVSVLGNDRAQRRYSPANPIDGLAEQQKIDLLVQAEKTARTMDARVKEVTVSLITNYEVVLVTATDGTFAADLRPLIRCNVQVIAEDNRGRQTGYAGCGGRRDVTWFADDERVERLAEEAVRRALVNLDAVEAPAGNMPVVLGPGWCGVLLHEAVGHGLEGDFNRKGSSNYAGRIGEVVASPLCTIVDDGTFADCRGSLSIDDEGTPTGENVLIENGVLKGYMQDKQNARLMKTATTGNGRRQSYAHLPMPRMTNTFMRAGESDPEEIIASVKKGIYAANFGGGQVDIVSGQFVFAATEAYLIEGGKITRPIKGATLIGNGPDVMQRVSMLGNDLSLDEGVGVCGKQGQSVPVGVGQPTLKIDEITVGGTQAA
ncbi:MAG: metalloprotease TldD [Pseudomonadota bacterium]